MPKFNPNPTPLEKARRAAGLTRLQLAEKSGVNARTIKGYEQRMRNINNAPVVLVLDLADAIGVPPRSILNGRGEPDA